MGSERICLGHESDLSYGVWLIMCSFNWSHFACSFIN